MFTEGKTTGTFKSVDEPYYISFVRNILLIDVFSTWKIMCMHSTDKVNLTLSRSIILTTCSSKLCNRRTYKRLKTSLVKEISAVIVLWATLKNQVIQKSPCSLNKTWNNVSTWLSLVVTSKSHLMQLRSSRRRTTS